MSTTTRTNNQMHSSSPSTGIKGGGSGSHQSRLIDSLTPLPILVLDAPPTDVTLQENGFYQPPLKLRRELGEIHQPLLVDPSTDLANSLSGIEDGNFAPPIILSAPDAFDGVEENFQKLVRSSQMRPFEWVQESDLQFASWRNAGDKNFDNIVATVLRFMGIFPATSDGLNKFEDAIRASSDFIVFKLIYEDQGFAEVGFLIDQNGNQRLCTISYANCISDLDDGRVFPSNYLYYPVSYQFDNSSKWTHVQQSVGFLPTLFRKSGEKDTKLQGEFMLIQNNYCYIPEGVRWYISGSISRGDRNSTVSFLTGAIGTRMWGENLTTRKTIMSL